jgi:hypothetical protein
MTWNKTDKAPITRGFRLNLGREELGTTRLVGDDSCSKIKGAFAWICLAGTLQVAQPNHADSATGVALCDASVSRATRGCDSDKGESLAEVHSAIPY